MALEEFPNKKVLAICSFCPELQKGYWLTVYADEEKTLTEVTQALKGTCSEIDQDQHRGYHNALHSGNGYTKEATYLHAHDQKDPHKHYQLDSKYEDLVEVKSKLESFIN